ncbi:nitroreductase family protein [Desulfovibrio sp. Huiquan2017]|uniref:nitroreductase family protein n=1 Tax=Desulfovibrio sp. Huiquan2017 TaxID=2816861 RepID=UPI001A91927E|nr:nitroreductase family protein [Desulfovibrio sp. Huiquan2017]
MITIDTRKCNRDGLCARACPVNLIKADGGEIPEEVDGAAERCIRCGHCVAVCPTNALTNDLTPAGEYLPVPEVRPDAEAMENLLMARRSVRDYRKAPVPREQLERLLETARRAPTASNSQKLSWTVIQSPEQLDRVREYALKWLANDPMRSRYVEAANQGKDVVLRTATTLLVAHGPKDYFWTATDSAIALTYVELLAAAMGLGTCWGGLVTLASVDIPDMLPILGVPEGCKVGGALMLGRPRQKHHLVPPRNPARVAWL